MRIVHIVQKLLPDPAADAESIVCTIAALGERGHDATLWVPRTPSAGDQSPEAIAGYYGIPATFRVVEQHFSADLHPFLLSYQHGRKTFSRLADDPPDAVFTTRLEILRLGLRKGAHMVFDHYRPWGDQFPILRPFLRRHMSDRNFLGALLHSTYSKEAFRRIGVPEDRLVVALNGFAPDRLAPRLDKKAAREQLSLPEDSRIVVYSGRFSREKGLDIVFRMAGLLPNVTFMLVGSRGRGPIEDAAESMDNVSIIPWQASSDLAPYLYAADVLLIPPTNAPLAKHGKTVLPLKTFLYLAAGRPILAPRAVDTRELLVHGSTAYLVPADDVTRAVDGLRCLLEDTALQERLGTGALARATVLTWGDRAAVIEAYLERALARFAAHGAVRREDTVTPGGA